MVSLCYRSADVLRYCIKNVHGSLKTELHNIQKRIEIIKDLFDTNYRKEIRPVICIIWNCQQKLCTNCQGKASAQGQNGLVTGVWCYPKYSLKGRYYSFSAWIDVVIVSRQKVYRQLL